MKKLYRSRTNRKLSGLCGGLGDYFKIDPTFIRLIVLFLCFFTVFFPVLIAYFIAVLIVPLEPLRKTKKHLHRLYKSKKNRVIAGVCGGFAEFFKIDATIVRLIFIFVMIITAVFPLLITYLIACLIIPERPGDIEIEKL